MTSKAADWEARIRGKGAQNGVPAHTIPGLVRYVVHGIPPGGFLTAVLENNLRNTVAHADEKNAKALKAICLTIYWEVPGDCHGSPEKVKKWIEKGGILEREATER